MGWNTISVEIKTSLSDAFFYQDEDNEKFDEWFQNKLQQIGLYDWRLEDAPMGIPGISKLSGYVNEFDDEHKLCVFIRVDDGTHSGDELAENDDLFNYIERTLVDRIIDELNALCNALTIPMYNGSFRELKFDGEEFYSMLYYSEQYGFYVSSQLKNSQFEIYPDFEVSL